MESYCMYLRKSRADADAEKRGEGETLSRHMNILAELARRYGFEIVKIYREIVSGENISARPQMQLMLADVAEKKYSGVLVMEIERLARGDTVDQGIVARIFRQSCTKIITPVKIYDPCNEFDEEYFEFSLFMSRREYKTINRRMQSGRLASAREGNYIASSAPYGYRKINPIPKVHTLEIIPEQAETVRLIYQMYLDGCGARAIAGELDRMGISPEKSSFWQTASIKKILSNPVYCGKISWKSKSNQDMLFRGRHEPVISEEIFQKVQEKKKNCPAVQVRQGDGFFNYYHGVLYCAKCRRQMRRRASSDGKHEYLFCASRECSGFVTASSFGEIDGALFAALRYRFSIVEKTVYSDEITTAEKISDKGRLIRSALEKAENQREKIFDLFEQGVYNEDIFRERMDKIRQKIMKFNSELSDCTEIPETETGGGLIVKIEDIINNFGSLSPVRKNRFLKNTIDKIFYSKHGRSRKNNSSLKLEIFFR